MKDLFETIAQATKPEGEKFSEMTFSEFLEICDEVRDADLNHKLRWGAYHLAINRWQEGFDEAKNIYNFYK